MRAHLAGTLERIVRLPVLLARRLLHEHKGLVFEAAHQIVTHGGQAPGRVVGGIVVPRDDVHLLGPAEIIEPLVGSHQVCGNGDVRVEGADDVALHLVIFQQAVGHKAAVINGNAREGRLFIVNAVAQRVGRDDLVPFVNGVTPELCIPGRIERFQCAVFFPQPDAERLLAVFAVALAAVLVADMPAGDVRVVRVAAGQFRDERACKFPEGKAVRAVVVPVPELVPPALVIDATDFGVIFRHPGGEGCRGGCHHDIVIFAAEHLHNVVKLREIKRLLVRLKLGPGKYVDGGGIDAGLAEELHVLVPNFARPLIRIVVAAVQNAAEGCFHTVRFLSFSLLCRKAPQVSSRNRLWRRIVPFSLCPEKKVFRCRVRLLPKREKRRREGRFFRKRGEGCLFRKLLLRLRLCGEP